MLSVQQSARRLALKAGCFALFAPLCALGQSGAILSARLYSFDGMVKALAANEELVLWLERVRQADNLLATAAGLQLPLFVAEQSDINAFAALANGKPALVVTFGALLLLRHDLDALAALLAHEYGHHAAGHKKESANTTVQNSDQTNETSSAKIGRGFVRFDLAQEFEADALGVSLLTRAGFDPCGALRLFDLIGQQSLTALLTMHPSSVQRRNELLIRINESSR